MAYSGNTVRRRLLPLLLVSTLVCAAAPAPAAPISTKRVLVHLRSATRGALVEGPRHSIHAIRDKPVRYAGMLVAIGALGAGAKLLGVNPEPFAIGFSALATGWSTWRALPLIRSAAPSERAAVVGREILWPVTLSAGTTVLGAAYGGHGDAHATVNAKIAAKAGVQSAVIGFDVPTIVQTVLDKEGAKPE